MNRTDLLAMAVEQQPELRVALTIGRKPSEVESPPHTVARVERFVYREVENRPSTQSLRGT